MSVATVHPSSTMPGLPPSTNGVVAAQAQVVSMVSSARVLSEVEEEYPLLSHGQYMEFKKEEDFAVALTDCHRVPGDSSTTFAAFMIFDGHNGPAAANYAKDHLLNDVMSCVPPNLTRDEWLTFLPKAMVAGFVKTDKEWQRLGLPSGTTATLVIVDGWTVTVACVGDSRCVLDAQGVASSLTIDHRLDGNDEELERIKATGAEVGRIKIHGGVEVGPLRVWPGGLCLSRSIGDMDVGAHVVAVPHVKQIKLSPAGGRLIIASDGVWDAVSTKKAARCCRGVQQPDVAAKYVVREAIRSRGLRDDTSCIVVDIASRSSELVFAPAMKTKLRFSRLMRCTSLHDMANADEQTHQEIHDENSPTLAQRLVPDSSVHAGNAIFLCALCRCNLDTEAEISVHAGSFFAPEAAGKPWESPFLCANCKPTEEITSEDSKAAPGKQPDLQKEAAKQDVDEEDDEERKLQYGDMIPDHN